MITFLPYIPDWMHVKKKQTNEQKHLFMLGKNILKKFLI